MKRFGLLPRLILGILCGILIGSSGALSHVAGSEAFQTVVRIFVTFTTLFSTFLSFLIPLLILSFVSVGLADLGAKANRLFVITLALAYGSTVLSGFFSYFAGSALLPFLVSPITGEAVAAESFTPLFTLEIPPVFGVMTALILSFLLGIGMANQKSGAMLAVFRDLKDIISKVLAKIVIPLIPFHIAGLFCVLAAEGRLAGTIKLFAWIFALILALQVVFILFLFGAASLVCRRNLYRQIKNVVPAYFTALGTQSSASTIPVSLKCAYRNGVETDVADFCIPLCATIHLNGDTIALVIGAIGLMLANGMSPSLALFVPFILMLGVTMVAAPGVPGGGVMAALGLFTSMLGFDQVMQQLIVALHFSQDSFGTAANVTGDQALTLIVDSFDKRGNPRREESE